MFSFSFYRIYIIIRVFCSEGRSFTANSGIKAAVLLKGRSSTANSATQAAALLGWKGAVASRCFPHLTLFSVWRDLKRSEKIPGAPAWRWGEWIWLTGPSGLNRNSPQGLNINIISSSWECSAQWQVFNCKLRHQGCSSAQRQVFTTNSGIKVVVLLGMNRCDSFPLLSAPHSLFSIGTDLKSIGYIYRVIQILCAHTDGCRLRPWLAYWPVSGPTYWGCFQTLTLLFQFIFRVDGPAHRHTFAKRKH